MKTGSDVVNTSTTEYQDLKRQLKYVVDSPNFQGPINVTVTGGASAVGSDRGFDNQKLANNRAIKMVDQLKKDIPGIDKKVSFKIVGKVGKATILNSDAAYKEQYVNVSFSTGQYADIRQTIETDNTAVNPFVRGIGTDKDKKEDKDIIPTPSNKTKRVCVKIPERLVEQFRLVVREFKSDYNLGDIPFGIYDVD